MYSFKCGDEIKNKLKNTSKTQSMHIKFEECKKCLDEEKKDYEKMIDVEPVRPWRLTLFFVLYTTDKECHPQSLIVSSRFTKNSKIQILSEKYETKDQ